MQKIDVIFPYSMQWTTRSKDEKLLEKINQGDPKAFEKAYLVYVDQIYRFIFLRVNDRDTTQDITSEVFLKVWRYVKEGERKITHLRGFFYQVARNLIADHYRTIHQAPLPLLENIDTHYEESGEAVIEMVGKKLDNEKLLQVIKTLPEEQQELIILRYIEELSLDEISTMLNKNKNALGVSIHRALQALEERLNRMMNTSP